MDVDSVPQSPATGPSGATSTPGTEVPSPVLKGSDTENDEAGVPAANSTAVVTENDGPTSAISDTPAGWPKAPRKLRDMFDEEIVDRWNAEFGDVFNPSDAAP
ncbi:hypothetical protein CspeluHIS016_0400590 [Cutaneotrichosporon spelunceum]|uniref:Uncharacterized protein n=1 Tax=Cutaneotrichosporon spelunceum TaxID=1672016 RepID=A0AAD3TUP8_9TREE|nr:hypothetical protein CspeluHIS016_0400590 [Cutaneotrichosporon spelunceum]